VPAGELAARGIEVASSERGGDVTFHEPGQMVGYPIVDLSGPAGNEIDLHDYLRRLEEGLIAYLAGAGLRADRIPGRTGVWIAGASPRKIAAIGIKARRRVASHGFALNVENCLAGFELIVPCGIRDAGVTSLVRELGSAAPAWEDAARGIHRALEAALGRKLRPVAGEEGLRLATGGRASS
jgi:lipoyl(octanoyl) transferase